MDKFEALPAKVQAVVQEAFELRESTDEEMKRINDAIALLAPSAININIHRY
jgi:hypothetical protein